jgi:outer membrane protein, heavy metal efflux system
LNLPLDCPLALGQRLTDFVWAPVQDLDAPDPNHPAAACPQSLAASLVAARPDLMAASAGVSVAGANMLLSKAARVPDIQAGPIYETADDGTHYLGLRLQSDVPVWNNGTPLLNQRRAELQQQRLSYAQLRERAMLEAQTTIDRYERARRFVAKSAGDESLVAGEAMPVELRQIMDQFAAGQAEVLAVFSTQNSLLQDRRAYLDLLNESAQAAANVVQAAALPPQRLALDRSTAGSAPLAEPVPPPPLAP